MSFLEQASGGVGQRDQESTRRSLSLFSFCSNAHVHHGWQTAPWPSRCYVQRKWQKAINVSSNFMLHGEGKSDLRPTHIMGEGQRDPLQSSTGGTL